MRRGFLVENPGARTERRAQVYDKMVLGRSNDCGFILDDVAASRRHAEIRIDGDDFLIADLGSTNGTLLNGSAIALAPLRPGDIVQVGDSKLQFESEETLPDPYSVFGEDTPTFLGAILDKTGEVVARPPAEKSNELLHAVYGVTNAIASIYDPCALVDRILETTVQAIHAERGAIYFAAASDESEEPRLGPCPVCGRLHVIREGRLGRSELDDVRISQTVARRVVTLGESVLYQDADDSEIRAAESVLALNIRSIMCAPLRAKSGIMGILYFDTAQTSHVYTHDDMLLATAVGNSAGLAIENAKMQRHMLEKQRIEQEIAHAWIIQEGFLHSDWDDGDPRFLVYGQTRPAKTVGGDFYDFVRPAPDLAGILIGDVSGKGVPAALTMAQLLAEFRLCAQGELSPAAVLRRLNEELFVRSRHGMFCTLCYVLVNLRTGEAVGCNAGHLPPLVVGAKGAALLDPASGPPVGVVNEGPWADQTWRLAPGDTLVLYTDGLMEAKSGGVDSPGEFGLERLCAVALACPQRDPRPLIDSLNEAVLAHCGANAPHDDCTLIALRYLGG